MSAPLYLCLAGLLIIVIVSLCFCFCFCCWKRKRPARDLEAQRSPLFRASAFHSVPVKSVQEQTFYGGLYERVIERVIRRPITRADAIKALIDERERLQSDENMDPLTADREMRPLIKQAVEAILNPKARGAAKDERNDVDLDLHRVRKRDAKGLVKLLIRRALFEKLKSGVGVAHKFAGTGVMVRVLRIDTGRGTHGRRGPVLQRTVRALLEQSRFRFETRPQPREGVFLVDPLSGDLDAAVVHDV